MAGFRYKTHFGIGILSDRVCVAWKIFDMLKIQIFHLGILVFLSAGLLNGQAFDFPLVFKDAAENRDTIVIGFHPDATSGIDTQFYEVNIISQPYNEGIDVRITDEHRRRYQDLEGTFHTKKQIVSMVGENAIAVDIKTSHFPVTAFWDKSLFQEDTWVGSLITRIYPGGWWDTGSPSDLGRVIFSEADSVVFTMNVFANAINENYAYVKDLDTFAVYWIALGPKNIGVSQQNSLRPAIRVYPNPVFDVLHVSGLDDAGEIRVEFFTTAGQKLPNLKNTNVTTFDVSFISPGPFLAKITSRQQVFYRWLFKG